jgi:uncharacterized protein (TIGR02246 family)
MRASVVGTLLICIAGSASAQQSRSLSEQEALRAAEAMTETYVSKFNAGDADGVSRLFGDNAVYLNPVGAVMTSREAIKNGFATRMKNGQPKLSEKVIEAHAIGDAVWVAGEWTLTPIDAKETTGHYAWIMAPEGNDWRFRMLISNLTPPR